MKDISKILYYFSNAGFLFSDIKIIKINNTFKIYYETIHVFVLNLDKKDLYLLEDPDAILYLVKKGENQFLKNN